MAGEDNTHLFITKAFFCLADQQVSSTKRNITQYCFQYTCVK